MRGAAKFDLYRAVGNLLGLFLFLEGEALLAETPSTDAPAAGCPLLPAEL
jgi:hypothetical protein